MLGLSGRSLITSSSFNLLYLSFRASPWFLIIHTFQFGDPCFPSTSSSFFKHLSYWKFGNLLNLTSTLGPLVPLNTEEFANSTKSRARTTVCMKTKTTFANNKNSVCENSHYENQKNVFCVLISFITWMLKISYCQYS